MWRSAEGHHHEVLVVHRAHQQDWSLPKGRRRRRESALECALREVREETGLRCTAGAELPEVRYTDGQGRPRRVRFWVMRSKRGKFRPNDEVDEIRWASLALVGELLTSERDLVVVSGLRLVRSTTR